MWRDQSIPLTDRSFTNPHFAPYGLVCVLKRTLPDSQVTQIIHRNTSTQRKQTLTQYRALKYLTKPTEPFEVFTLTLIHTQRHANLGFSLNLFFFFLQNIEVATEVRHSVCACVCDEQGKN